MNQHTCMFNCLEYACVDRLCAWNNCHCDSAAATIVFLDNRLQSYYPIQILVISSLVLQNNNVLDPRVSALPLRPPK